MDLNIFQAIAYLMKKILPIHRARRNLLECRFQCIFANIILHFL